MKKYLALLLALVLTLSLSFAIAENPDDYYLEIKFSNVFQPTEWNYKASQKLADMITERTEGHISVTYYGQNELANHEGMAPLLTKAASILVQRGVLLDFRIVPGGEHNEASWERQIPFFLNAKVGHIIRHDSLNLVYLISKGFTQHLQIENISDLQLRKVGEHFLIGHTAVGS